MAVLQKIRNKAGILVMVFVGVALFLFIIDPTTFQQLFTKSDTSIAEINGEKIEYEEFQDFYKKHHDFLVVAQQKTNLEEDQIKGIRDQSWNDILQEHILKPYYEEVGLSVSEAELEDLLYGSNIHYIINQNFKNPQTQQIDTNQVRDFFDRASEDPNYQIIAEYWKDVIKQDRLQTKYNNMVAKGFYVPTAFAKIDYENKNNTFDFEYVFRAYKEIKDEDITVSDEDIKAYYDEHQHMFKVDEKNRDIEYIVFEVLPSSEDSLAILEELKEIYAEFNTLEEGHADFASRYTEVGTRDIFLSENELPIGLPEDFYNQEVGTTSDIILSGNNYYFTKIIDEAERPDSVKASHILFMPNDSVSLTQCHETADSIKSLIDNGEDFAILALMNSQDPGSKEKGGSLGWFSDGMMVPEFNEACFNGKAGDVVIVETQFGVHIIKIEEQAEYNRKIKLATVVKEIRFSDKTSNHFFSIASNFSAENTTAKKFDEAVIKNKYVKKSAEQLKELDASFSGVENAREIVRWLYREDAKVGDVSNVFNFQDKFIVAKISAIKDKGFAPIETVTETIRPIVLKNKKSEKLIAEFNKDLSAKLSLNDIAEKYNKKIDTLTKIGFNSFSLPGLGIEPNVTAVISYIEKDKVSEPIKGTNGVFIVKVVNQNPAPEKTDFTEDKLSSMKTQATQVYKIFEAIKKQSDITDNRARYF